MGGFSYLHGGTLLYEDELGRVPPELLERFRESLVTKFADASAIAQPSDDWTAYSLDPRWLSCKGSGDRPIGSRSGYPLQNAEIAF